MVIAVSSWALHRTIGVTYPDSPATGPQGRKEHSAQAMEVAELGAALRSHEYDTAEICHFHLPGREGPCLEEIRAKFEAAGVTIQSLLIDDGDISDEECGSRDAEWIGQWIDAAAGLGAKRARVIAGKQPYSDSAFDRAAGHLSALSRRAGDQGVRLSIENWFPLLASPEAVLKMLDRTQGSVGLCADMGNWEAPRKYEDLPKIFGRAETCHAKCDFIDAGTIDMGDYSRCLAIAAEAGYDGPMVLVNGGPADEWNALELTRRAILAAG